MITQRGSPLWSTVSRAWAGTSKYRVTHQSDSLVGSGWDFTPSPHLQLPHDMAAGFPGAPQIAGRGYTVATPWPLLLNCPCTNCLDSRLRGKRSLSGSNVGDTMRPCVNTWFENKWSPYVARILVRSEQCGTLRDSPTCCAPEGGFRGDGNPRAGVPGRAQFLESSPSIQQAGRGNPVRGGSMTDIT